jgi:hypothetical protein
MWPITLTIKPRKFSSSTKIIGMCIRMRIFLLINSFSLFFLTNPLRFIHLLNQFQLLFDLTFAITSWNGGRKLCLLIIGSEHFLFIRLNIVLFLVILLQVNYFSADIWHLLRLLFNKTRFYILISDIIINDMHLMIVTTRFSLLIQNNCFINITKTYTIEIKIQSILFPRFLSIMLRLRRSDFNRDVLIIR